MMTQQLRCVSCGHIFHRDSGVNGCPMCHSIVSDPVIMFLDVVDHAPIVPINSLMPAWPKVMGLKITSQN